MAKKRVFEAPDKFWEVWIEGKTVYTRFGKTGAAGQTRLKEVADPKAEVEKQIAAKVREGFLEEGGAPAKGKAAKAESSGGDARNEALEAAIVADPYDAEAYSVYADWLQAQGDPRGELIALHIHGKAKPAKALLQKHIAYFLGTLVDDQQCRDGYTWQKDVQKEAFIWKNGFIQAARLSHDANAYEDWTGEMSDVLTRLLAHPSGRFLAELTLMYNGESSSSGNLQTIIDALVKKPRSTLRKLVIGDNVDQISWYQVGKLGKLWAALPNLATFEMEAGVFNLGTAIDASNLTRMIVKTGGLTKANAKALASMRAPKLQHLEIYFGDDQYGGNASAKDIAPLLARTDLPALRHLGLENSMFANDIVRLLPMSKLLPKLTTLDLSQGVLDDEGAKLLAAHADAYEHLELLNLDENYLTKAGQKLVRGIAKKVEMREQKDIEEDDPEWRYVSVSE